MTTMPNNATMDRLEDVEDAVDDELDAIDLEPIEIEIASYLDDELDDDEKARFEKKLDSDPSLRERVERERDVWNALDALDDAIEDDAIARERDLVETTVERLNSETRAELAALDSATAARRRRRALVAVAAAIALFLAGYLASAALAPNARRQRERDARVVERLAQFETVGSYEFLRKLNDSKLLEEWKRLGRDAAQNTREKEDARAASERGERPYDELVQDRVFYRLQRRFEALPSEEQKRWRALKREIDDDDDSQNLLQTLDDFAVWFVASANAEERERFVALNPNEKLDFVRRKIQDAARWNDFFKKARADEQARNPQRDDQSAQDAAPPQYANVFAMRRPIPIELRNENLQSIYRQYADYFKAAFNRWNPDDRAEHIDDFVKKTPQDALVKDFSDSAKKFWRALPEQEREKNARLLVSISVAEENDKKNATSMRPFPPAPRRRGQFDFRNPEFKARGDSARELAKALRNAPPAARDYITSCPAQEARGLLMGLQWGAMGNWDPNRFAPQIGKQEPKDDEREDRMRENDDRARESNDAPPFNNPPF